MTEVLSQDDQGSVGKIHRQIGVLVHESHDPRRVLFLELKNLEGTLYIGTKEAQLALVTHSVKQQVAGLGHNRPGADEWLVELGEPGLRAGVVAISPIGESYPEAAVSDDHVSP